MATGSMSVATTVSHPARSRPTSRPPAPLKSETTLSRGRTARDYRDVVTTLRYPTYPGTLPSVPTPGFSTSPDVHQRMSRQPRRDTLPELALRRELHRRGLRYFVHRRPVPKLRREADLVFPRRHIAVFIDGCFWHGCPAHARLPDLQSEYWQLKIATNQARDRNTDAQLARAGWTVLRFWEHESPSVAADKVEGVITKNLQERS